MLGSSRTSFESARTALSERGSSDAGLSEELLQVSNALASAPALRSALSDSGTESAARVSLARSVFEGKVGSDALSLIADVAGRRWNSSTDLVDAVEALGFEAGLMAAERAGRLDDVEDELFRVDRLVAGDDRLRQTLSDPAVNAAARAEMLNGLISGQVDDTTAGFVRHLVTNPRGRQLGEALAALVDQSARRRERLLARIKVAAPISADQEQRLAAVLGRIYNRDVDLQIEVDPGVLGGIVVRVGDEVIDGSVVQRLEDIRRKFGAAK